ncbi:MAG: HAD family phosphatase [Spirochaeta sp.]|jgi:putative hydrolase of the HAD superfamily|nr:HAD family phosphatase [Spirochaeta sp.]
MPNITTIAFDFGGVLVQRISDEFICHMAYAAGADPERFVPTFWRLRNDFDSGALDARTYWHTVMSEAGSDPSRQPGTEEETIDLLMHLDALGWASIHPGMLRWISALRHAGFRRMIISNMAAETYDLIIRNSALLHYFERVVLSGWIGINKPDRRIFEAAATEMEVEPGEMLFIDDLAHNVEGAKAAGLHAVQFRDPQTFADELRERYPEIPGTGILCSQPTMSSGSAPWHTME